MNDLTPTQGAQLYAASTIANAPALVAPMTPDQVKEWLQFEYAPLLARRDDFVAALERCLEAYPEIKSDEELAIIIENIKGAAEIRKLAAAAHTTAKAPFFAAGKAVDGWKNGILDSFEKVISKLQPIMDTWGRKELARKQAIAAENARVLREKAEAEAAAAVALAQTEAPDTIKEAAFGQVEQSARDVEKAEAKVDAPAADHTRVRTAMGAVASMKTTWKWRVSDIRQVPEDLLSVNAERVNFLARERDPATRKPIVNIPGIEFYADQSMAVR
jgi:hypothetical protein